MVSRVIGVVALCLGVSSSGAGAGAAARFTAWQAHHGVVYPDPATEAARLTIFNSNLVIIEEFNRRAEAAGRSMRLGMNRFGDLTNDEYRGWLRANGYGRDRDSVPTSAPGTSQGPAASKDLSKDSSKVGRPDSWDWVQEGVVAPIKNQGQCGSCWAFSAVAAMEGAFNRAHVNGSMPPQCVSRCGPRNVTCCSFSEQEVADCTLGGGDSCTKGGEPHDGILNIVANGGRINTEAQYPYTSGDSGNLSKCSLVADPVTTGITGYQNVSSGDEDALADAVYGNSIISVGIDASQLTFQFYSKGIYEDHKCKNTLEKLDHGVAVVGYGTGAAPEPPMPPPPPPGPRSCIGMKPYQCQRTAGCNLCKDKNGFQYCVPYPDTCTGAENSTATSGGRSGAGAGADYWIVKNSWGTSWGVGGYIFMSRNKDNQCGIATDATWAVLG